MLFSKGILASRDAPELKASLQGSIAGEPFFVVMGEVDFVDEVDGVDRRMKTVGAGLVPALSAMPQYALANTTFCAAGLPLRMQVPGSSMLYCWR